MYLVFKIQKAQDSGKSPILIKIFDKNKTSEVSIKDTDLLLQAIDKLLKKNKIKVESLKDIRVEIDNEAGLTSTRIVLAIIKALRFNLD